MNTCHILCGIRFLTEEQCEGYTTTHCSPMAVQLLFPIKEYEKKCEPLYAAFNIKLQRVCVKGIIY